MIEVRNVTARIAAEADRDHTVIYSCDGNEVALELPCARSWGEPMPTPPRLGNLRWARTG